MNILAALLIAWATVPVNTGGTRYTSVMIVRPHIQVSVSVTWRDSAQSVLFYKPVDIKTNLK